MPESPEVQALVDDLAARLRGRRLRAVDVLEFRAVKTRAAPPSTLVGHAVTGAARHGKHVELTFDDERLVVSLGRHGWMRWRDPAQPGFTAGRAPALASLEFDDGTVLDLTDAGSWISLGLHVVDEADEVPAISALGRDPLDPGYARDDFDAAFGRRRKQAKAVLQEQDSIAGIGNAYSDEILHAARVSPVVHASSLSPADRERLFTATIETMRRAVVAQRGVPIDRLKATKVASMRVHGRAGEPCPACGDVVREFAFASTTAQYCATCQTGGAIL